MSKVNLLFLLLLPQFVFAQPPVTSSTPYPLPTPSIGRVEPVNNRTSVEMQEEKLDSIQIAENRNSANRLISEIYRKPKKSELMAVRVDSDLTARFGEFLKSSNTGITKFLDDSVCSENPSTIVVSAGCPEITLPGFGASFSFRSERYVISRFADLKLSKDRFKTPGIWVQGILVNIGDVSIDTLNSKSSELDGLLSFQTASDFRTSKKLEGELIRGIKKNNRLYTGISELKENTTFLLRSIAYRGVIRKSIKGVTYNELDYDKRKDVVVAFRIVRLSSNGSVTIIWKRLLSQDSPKLVRNPKSQKEDLKDDKFPVAKSDS